LLPVGVHDCTLEEIRARFGSFQGTDHRTRLFQKLQDLVAEARAAKFCRSLLVDGSFATAKLNPNDIDLVLVLPLEHDVEADLTPAAYALVSKKRVQKRFGFDIVSVREQTPEYDEAVAFFQQVRGQRAFRKGILKLAL
jgi:hypothetical protein